MATAESKGKLGFLDPLTRLFGRRESATEAPPASAPTAAPSGPAKLEAMEAEFAAALQGLEAKIQARVDATAPTSAAAGARRATAADREAERLRRMEECHAAIRADVEAMHQRLGTGLGAKDLPDLATFLLELEADAKEGKDSHAILPRARYAIAQKLQTEAGELAADRTVALLESHQVPWPDPTQSGPNQTAEEIERSRRRRLAETRESFLASGLKRTAERLLGIVSAWGSDYPERGSPLWVETTIEAVAAGLRASLVRDAVELLRRGNAPLVAKTEELVGAEVAALQRAVQGGVTSIEQANQAVSGALRVLDEVLPTLAWEQVRAELPRARGEW